MTRSAGSFVTDTFWKPAAVNAASIAPDWPRLNGPGWPGLGGGRDARLRMIETGTEKKRFSSAVA
jgi:hypothetical protein